jgi:hypothetical protein
MFLTDDRKYLGKQLTNLSVKFSPTASIEILKDLLEATEAKRISDAIEETAVAL